MTGEQGNRTRLVKNAPKAASHLDFGSHRFPQVHADNVVDEFAPIPLEIGDVLLFDNQAAPVRGGTGKDNPRARISGENFIVCCTQDRNVRLWLHHRYLMILRLSRFGRTPTGAVKIAGGMS